MMRTFAPLTESDLPVPGPVLDALVDSLGPLREWVVIGATARDFGLHLGKVSLPRRATKDIDLAVAAHDTGDFESILAGVGDPATAWQRRLVLGQQVDIVPFGGLELDGHVTLLNSTLTVLGLAEAAAQADLLVLPSGRVIPVAPLELVAILKMIAFSDRHPAVTKDVDDLRPLGQLAGRAAAREVRTLRVTVSRPGRSSALPPRWLRPRRVSRQDVRPATPGTARRRSPGRPGRRR